LSAGLMGVFAVSGSVVFLAMHVHKRLLHRFMQKFEFEFNHSSGRMIDDGLKKKVRFEVDARMPRVNQSSTSTAAMNDRNLPQNWQVIYKGILKSKN
ncbi:hypothetical protein M569_06089, partial [Genlisea aurea]